MRPIAAILLLLLSIVSPPPSLADSYDPDNYKPTVATVTIDETNLPIVFIDTRCGEDDPKVIHKDWRVAARMKIIHNPDGINYGDTIAHPGQTTDYEGWVAIRYRGNTSFTLSDKKPFSIKTLQSSNVDGERQKVAIMGMPKDNDWVLLAPFTDRSLIRDVLMFQLERPFLDFTPKARHCELILDGIYYGIYIMTERVSKGKYRLNLDDPGTDGDELTGGYLLQIDRNDEDHYYTSKHFAVNENGDRYSVYYRIYFQYMHPEYDEMMPAHPEQLQYIQQQIDLMEDALAADNYTDPDFGYRRYLDVLSFIDYELAQEFSGNFDGFRLSTPIYKRRDSEDPRFKLSIWDFNIALGNNVDGKPTDLWHYQNKWKNAYDAYNKVPFWWVRLMDDPAYVKRLKQRWAEYRLTAFSDEHIEQTIDSMVTLLNSHGALDRNFTAYPLWGKRLWSVPDYKTVNTYEKEIAYLKEWIADRTAWMDEQLEYDTYSGPEQRRLLTEGYYNLRGQRLRQPQRGIVIIRYKDGTSRKVLFSR